MLDNKRLQLFAGVEISFLQKKEMDWIEDMIKQRNAAISAAQATTIKGYSQKRELTKALLERILFDEKKKPRRFMMKADRLSQYFDDDYTDEEIEETIIRLLDEWKKKEGSD